MRRSGLRLRQPTGTPESRQALDYRRLAGRFVVVDGFVGSAPPIYTARVEHKLGRQPRGWSVTDHAFEGHIWREDWDETHIVVAINPGTTDSALEIEVW